MFKFRYRLQELALEKSRLDKIYVTQVLIAAETGVGVATINRIWSEPVTRIDSQVIAPLAAYFQRDWRDLVELVEAG